jgi:cytochrome c556
MMTRLVFAVAAAVALATTAVVAQSDPIAARKALMKANNDHARNLGRIVRGEDPFDAAKVDAAFAQWADTAAKFGALFPDNSKTGDTRALVVIWEKPSDFQAAIAKFAKDVSDNRDKAKTLDGLKAAMPVVGKNCGDCHEVFRRRS